MFGAVANVLLFFGAGASAPFGIPTMQGMVKDFEQELQKSGSSEKLTLYRDVRSFLTNTLSRTVDLEAVFTIIDSIVNWSPDRMGVAALYHATRAASAMYPKTLIEGEAASEIQSIAPLVRPPAAETVRVAKSLEADFEKFVQGACQIPEDRAGEIDEVYKTFFDCFSVIGGSYYAGQSGRGHAGLGPMFTTNYDPVLEHYWLDIIQLQLNTGFQYNPVARMEVSNPDLLRGGDPRLFKLHGSVTWLRDERWGLTELRVPPHEMMTFTRRKFLGRVMLYPIEEKDLFVEPYETMYLMLNRELATARKWVVVGYSFGDRILRDIFVQNSRKETSLILLHPEATHLAQRLVDFQGTVKPLDGRFGGRDFSSVADQLRRLLSQG